MNLLPYSLMDLYGQYHYNQYCFCQASGLFCVCIAGGCTPRTTLAVPSCLPSSDIPPNTKNVLLDSFILIGDHLLRYDVQRYLILRLGT